MNKGTLLEVQCGLPGFVEGSFTLEYGRLMVKKLYSEEDIEIGDVTVNGAFRVNASIKHYLPRGDGLMKAHAGQSEPQWSLLYYYAQEYHSYSVDIGTPDLDFWAVHITLPNDIKVSVTSTVKDALSTHPADEFWYLTLHNTATPATYVYPSEGLNSLEEIFARLKEGSKEDAVAFRRKEHRTWILC